MKFNFCHANLLLLLFLLYAAGQIYAAPLEGTLASASSASKEERDAALWNARSKVVAAAGKYEKTPYRYGGIDLGGIDCSGLVYASFKDALSVTVPRSASGLYNWSEKINVNKLQPGDLVFFKTDNSGNITHVGIYIGSNRFIHSASAGPKTGVIYSDLNESYWKRTFAGAGRALPESGTDIPKSTGNQKLAASDEKSRKIKAASASSESAKNNSPFTLGFAAAPSWNAFLSDGKIIRGFASQIRIAADTVSGNMNLGLELRPEWDGALGIFRLPITLSAGNDKFYLFGGPVISFGDAVLKTTAGDRYYSHGTAWFGTAGIHAAPLAIKISHGQLAPYAELAWQSYFSANSDKNLNADFAAGLRLSTGLRYTWKF